MSNRNSKLNLAEAHIGPILFFDGVCNLCNSSVDLVIRWDKKSKFRYGSLQSETAKRLLSETSINFENPESFVYYNSGRIKQKSNAVLTILLKLGFPFALLYIFKIVPRFLRNYLYDVIARNRYNWFGKKDSCRLPTEAERSLFFD